MLRFKQFLIERSVEDQLKSVAANRETALNMPNPGNPTTSTGKFPRIDTRTILPGEPDWISPEAGNSVQLIANPDADAQNSRVLGMYHADDRTVVVNKTNDLRKNTDTLTHELAHHDQHVRQMSQGKDNLVSRSPGIAAPTDKKNPFAYPEYAYTDIETNARTVSDADAAGRAYKTKLDAALKGLDPAKDAAKIQEIKNNLRSEVMDTHMAAERKMSADNIRQVLNAKNVTPQETATGIHTLKDAQGNKISTGTTPAERAAAMDKVLDAAGKAERGTQEGIARSMQAVERGEFNPNTPSLKGGSVNPVVNTLTKPLPGSNIPGVGAVANLAAGAVGAAVGEYVVKPAAEKAGVFDAVEKGTQAGMSKMSPGMQNAVSTGLDVADTVANAIVNPQGSFNEFLANQARNSPPPTEGERKKASERFEKQNY